MKAFYRERQRRHQKQLNKYLKYVFNDHIGLVLIFILGGGMFYYSQFLEQVDATFFVGKIIVALVWLIALSIGSLATLVVAADAQFLLPKEDEMSEYFRAAFFHSLKIPSVIIFAVTLGAMPLLIRISHVEWYELIFYLVTLLGLKMIHLRVLMDRLYTFKQSSVYSQTTLVYHWLFSVIIVFSSTLFYSWLGSILIVIYGMILFYAEKNGRRGSFNWLLAIELEQARQKRIAAMINLFTDVPNMATPIRRRRYLDNIIERYSQRYPQTYDYLYIRSFLRGTSYLGVTFRLVLIGMISGLFIDDGRLLLPLFLVIIFGIGFQLVPLYQHYDYQVMTQLYPVPVTEKARAVQRLWTVILSAVLVVFSVIAIIGPVSLDYLLITITAMMIEVLFLIKYYLPKRLKR